MNVKMPDGTVIEGVPDNITKAELMDKLKARGTLDLEKMTYAPTQGMGTGERMAAGAGKAVADAISGGRQLVGAESQANIAETAKRDEPLMASPAGKVGNILGNVGIASPSILVPGANTVTGATATGAVLGALQPVETGNVATGKMKNAIVGGALSGGAQAVVPGIANMAKDRAASLGQKQMSNAVRDATLLNSQDAGYVVPPSQANPTLVNKAAEGFAGKLTTAQAASAKNQEVTNGLARQSLNLPPDTPLTKVTLKTIRKTAGQAYETIRGVDGMIGTDQRFTTELAQITQKFQGAEKDFPELAKSQVNDIVASVNKPQFSADAGISAIRILRDKTDDAYAKGDKSLGAAYRQASSALEDLIDRNLAARGPQFADMLSEYRDARQMIAKTYSVESALNDATGNVNATKLGAQLKRNKPLDADLKTAGQFANAYPRAAQENLSSMPGISPLDYGAAGIASAAVGNPSPMAAVTGRPLMRSLILSKPYQDRMTTPSYEPSLLTKIAPGVFDNSKVQALLRNLAPSAAFSIDK